MFLNLHGVNVEAFNLLADHKLLFMAFASQRPLQQAAQK